MCFQPMGLWGDINYYCSFAFYSTFDSKFLNRKSRKLENKVSLSLKIPTKRQLTAVINYYQISYSLQRKRTFRDGASFGFWEKLTATFHSPSCRITHEQLEFLLCSYLPDKTLCNYLRSAFSKSCLSHTRFGLTHSFQAGSIRYSKPFQKSRTCFAAAVGLHA